jgi:hypothetical protein
MKKIILYGAFVIVSTAAGIYFLHTFFMWSISAREWVSAGWFIFVLLFTGAYSLDILCMPEHKNEKTEN